MGTYLGAAASKSEITVEVIVESSRQKPGLVAAVPRGRDMKLELPWSTLRAPRGEWSVVLTPPLIYDGNKVHGLTWFRRRTVYVDCTGSRKKIRSTFFHELFHVIAFEARGRQRAGNMLGIVEEDFAALFESRAASKLLGHLGVSVPPLPEGFAKFRRQCMGKTTEMT